MQIDTSDRPSDSQRYLATKGEFGNIRRLHVEFWVPAPAGEVPQLRGNSGVYLQGRYEVQILESYGLPPGNTNCGALYNGNIVELSGGRIATTIRADRLGGVLYHADSKDGGRTWRAFATKTDIPNPGSKATLYPLGGDAVALLHNPNPGHRSPLALWISFDGLKTWPYRRVLAPESSDGPKGQLNYPDGFVNKNREWLHFAYDDNRHRAVYYGAKLPPIR